MKGVLNCGGIVKKTAGFCFLILLTTSFYSLVRKRFGRSAIALDGEFALASHQGFALRLMRLSMLHRDIDPAIAVELVHFLLPRAAAVGGPLERERLHLPMIGVEVRRKLES